MNTHRLVLQLQWNCLHALFPPKVALCERASGAHLSYVLGPVLLDRRGCPSHMSYRRLLPAELLQGNHTVPAVRVTGGPVIADESRRLLLCSCCNMRPSGERAFTRDDGTAHLKTVTRCFEWFRPLLSSRLAKQSLRKCLSVPKNCDYDCPLMFLGFVGEFRCGPNAKGESKALLRVRAEFISNNLIIGRPSNSWGFPMKLITSESPVFLKL
ncbi:hypothetical protein J6590_009238 [Homalodisca vitripennis]|nr:hypothetical protein J6590_009238 [Homalodisca vitripennis]